MQLRGARTRLRSKVEHVLHKVFDSKRVRKNREFFTADPELARLIIDLVKLEERPLSDGEQGITPDQRNDIEMEKSRRSAPLTFERLGLQAGVTLAFIKDPQVTCQVASAIRVQFRGGAWSLSTTALKVLHDMNGRPALASPSAHAFRLGLSLDELG